MENGYGNSGGDLHGAGEWHILNCTTGQIIRRYSFYFAIALSGWAGYYEGPLSIKLRPDGKSIEIETLGDGYHVVTTIEQLA